MSILIFLAVLFVLILVHEWGHFIVAKKTGMRVDEFGIGFPPKLFGIKKGETEYTFNALPIGGFVKILGENSETGVDAADNERSFVAKSKLAQAAVLFAGVTMNALFAWLLFIVVFTMGVPTAVDEATAGPEARLIVSQVLPEGPAAAAMIPVGAVLTNVTAGGNELTTLTPSTFSDFTKQTGEEELLLTYEQGGETFTTAVTPQAGIITDRPADPAIGVALALVETVRTPFHLAIVDGFMAMVTGLRDITIGLSSLIYDAFLGQADFSQVAGPVGIVGLVGDAAGFGLTSLLLFTAFISLNLAVINLLPFPALDGGRLVMVAIEATTRRPINPVWVGRVNLVGFALLMLLMVAVTYNDILRIL